MNTIQPSNTNQDVPNFNTTEIGKSLENVASNIGQSLVKSKDVVFNSINDFGNATIPSIKEASNEFLNANTMIAKFIFVIMAVIIFLVFFKIAVYFLNYYYSPKTKTVLVNGFVSGNSGIVIRQNPKDNALNLVTRSNDRVRGLEASWTFWIYVDGNGLTSQKKQHVFNKGNNKFAEDGVATTNNAPGVYVSMDGSNNNATLNIYFDTQTNNRSSFVIDNIPMQKWFFVSIILKGNFLDVYINGSISQRETVNEVFKQNFDPIQIGANGGFNGKLSNLVYYSYAVSPFQLQNIYATGPNLTESSLTAQSSTSNNYISSMWYYNRL